MWTAMIALVRSEICSSTSSTAMFQVLGSASTNTIFAPVYSTAFGEAIMVNVGRITSSPALIFRPASAKWSAVVPLFVATPNFESQNPANLRSNSWTCGPIELIQEDLMHCVTSSTSLSPTRGAQTGIFLCCNMLFIVTLLDINYRLSKGAP